MRFLRRFLAFLGVIVLAYLTVVVVVNPRGEFPSRRFPWVLPNSRRVKLELYQAALETGPVPGIVLGSSRSMKLSPELLGAASGLRFFNFAVFSGTIEDDLAIMRLTIRRGSAPAEVVLGLEQSSLEPAEPNPELASNYELSSALNGSRPTAASRFVHWAKLAKGALTPGYAVNVVRSMQLALWPELPIHAFSADGVVRYLRQDSEIAAGRNHAAADIAAALPLWKATPVLHTPDSTRVAELKELLRIADSVGAHVTVWLTPLHPSVVAILAARQDYQQSLAVVRTRIESVARDYHASFVDLTDPGILGSPPELWYDSEHYGDRFASRIVPVLVAAGVGGSGAR